LSFRVKVWVDWIYVEKTDIIVQIMWQESIKKNSKKIVKLKKKITRQAVKIIIYKQVKNDNLRVFDKLCASKLRVAVWEFLTSCLQASWGLRIEGCRFDSWWWWCMTSIPETMVKKKMLSKIEKLDKSLHATLANPQVPALRQTVRV